MRVDELRRRAALLAGLPEDILEVLAAMATDADFRAGELLFREDGPADHFFIVESGVVALELATPRLEPISILTIGPSELVGISWMFPPYRWNFSARAIQPTRAIAFDAARVREECLKNDTLMIWVLRVVAEETAKRLYATRVQLLDVYEIR